MSEARISTAQRLAHIARRAAGGGDVALGRVVHHHAIGVEAPAGDTGCFVSRRGLPHAS